MNRKNTIHSIRVTLLTYPAYNQSTWQMTAIRFLVKNMEGFHSVGDIAAIAYLDQL